MWKEAILGVINIKTALLSEHEENCKKLIRMAGVWDGNQTQERVLTTEPLRRRSRCFTQVV
jgi:hypothetical protein